MPPTAATGPQLYEVRFQVDLPRDPAATWASWTTTATPLPFFFGLAHECPPVVGGPLVLRVPGTRRAFLAGTWVEVEPEEHLAADIRLHAFPHEEVRWRWWLRPEAGGTRLVTSYRGSGLRTILRARQGHPHVDAALKLWMTEGRVPQRMRLYSAVVAIRSALPGARWPA